MNKSNKNVLLKWKCNICDFENIGIDKTCIFCIKKWKCNSCQLFNKLENTHCTLCKSVKSDYFPQNGYQVSQKRLEPIARIILMGVYDDNNSLSIFRGMRYIIKKIWELTIQFNRHYYSPYIQIKSNPYNPSHDDHTSVAFHEIELNKHVTCRWDDYMMDGIQLTFPKPLKEQININMMPIWMIEDELENQLTQELHGYIPWIKACLAADVSQEGEVCFLTIHESFVEKGKTQRRPGLHIELPGVAIGGDAKWAFTGWGQGYNRRDGIYMASNISDTCVVWNCRIIERDDINDGKVKLMDNFGGLEYLKSIMPNEQKYSLKGGKLYWITDRTPHIVLPMKKDGWRQFFRLVSHKLGAWYEQHSTKNPIGIVPNTNITKIVKGNKFKNK